MIQDRSVFKNGQDVSASARCASYSEIIDLRSPKFKISPQPEGRRRTHISSLVWEDHLHTATDLLHTAADHLHIAAELLHTAADHLHIAADHLHIAAELLHTAADRLHTAADRLHTAADLV